MRSIRVTLRRLVEAIKGLSTPPGLSLPAPRAVFSALIGRAYRRKLALGKWQRNRSTDGDRAEQPDPQPFQSQQAMPELCQLMKVVRSSQVDAYRTERTDARAERETIMLGSWLCHGAKGPKRAM